MIREALIQQISRIVHNGFPSDDTDVTDDLINLYINQGIAIAVKNNYKDSIQMDGIGYVNNSFYTTFKGIVITADEENLWNLELPLIPIAIGRNEGVARLIFKNAALRLSYDAIPLATNQLGVWRSMRVIPNKIVYYVEGGEAKVISSLNMADFTANITLISGGDSTNINSQLNVPDDYIPTVIDYCVKLLSAEMNMKQDLANDGTNRV